MKRKIVLSVCVIALLAASSSFAQQAAPKSESSKYRTIFTLGGAGAGFALGLGGGLAAFDDAVNSNRKVWTTAILAGIGGGVGGYFIGRALDKHKAKTSWRYIPDQLDRGLIPYQLPGTPTDGDSVSMQRVQSGEGSTPAGESLPLCFSSNSGHGTAFDSHRRSRSKNHGRS
jgi:hypothetical protein